MIPATSPRWRGYLRLSLILLAVFLVSSCSRSIVQNNYTWAWWTVSPFTPRGQRNLLFMLRGFMPTLTISFTALLFSIPAGVIVALFAFVPLRGFQWFNRVYVETVRSIPTLVLILWVYYGLPVSVGLDLNVFSAGVVALAISDSAFQAEIFRGGIRSISHTQIEAGLSLGLSPFQVMRLVIMPQAIRRILPPLGNQLVYMLKISSLVSMIGFQELTRRARELATVEFSPLEIYTALIFMYLVLILGVSGLVRLMERKLKVNYRD